MTKDAKQRFLHKLEQMAEDLYRQGDSISHDDAWVAKRNFIWGYSNAGKTIKLVTAEEIQTAIDRSHKLVYGESRENRKQQFEQLLSGSENIDWDAFNAPTYERKSRRS